MCTHVPAVENCNPLLIDLLKHFSHHAQLVHKECDQVDCTVMALVYQPADVANAIHDAVQHTDETQCGASHVARDLLYLILL